MSMCWHPGPVFTWDSILLSRKWQLYAVRSVYLFLFLLLWATVDAPNDSNYIGTTIFQRMISIQLIVVFLIAPLPGMDLCLDKKNGKLVQLMVTALTDVEIVLGKLASGLLVVLTPVACTFPVVMMVTFLGGVGPDQVIGSYLVTFGVALLGCGLGLVLAVWGTRPYAVLLAAFFVEIVWIFFAPVWVLASQRWGFMPLPSWVARSNPFVILAGMFSQGTVHLSDTAIFFAGCVVVSAVLLSLVIWRIRAVTLAQTDRPEKPRRAYWLLKRLFEFLPAPSLDGNPVLWLQWRQNFRNSWARIPWMVYFLFGIILVVHEFIVWYSEPGAILHFHVTVGGWQIFVGLILLSASSASSLGEDRDRGILDPLLSSPLSSREIVMGKWWAAFLPALLLAILPLAVMGIILMAGISEKEDRLIISLRIYQLILMVGSVLGYTAAIASLGTIMAIRLPSTKWAMACSTVISAVFLVLIRAFDWFGALRPARVPSHFFMIWNFEGAWKLHALIFLNQICVPPWLCYLLLYYATAKSFDEQTGRMPERQAAPKAH